MIMVRVRVSVSVSVERRLCGVGRLVLPRRHLAPVGSAACPLPRLSRVPHVAARAWFGWGARIGLRGWWLGLGVGARRRVGVGLRGWG